MNTSHNVTTGRPVIRTCRCGVLWKYVGELLAETAGLAHARQVAMTSAMNTGTPIFLKKFSAGLQRDGFAVAEWPR
jgi:hypothetical protein